MGRRGGLHHRYRVPITPPLSVCLRRLVFHARTNEGESWIRVPLDVGSSEAQRQLHFCAWHLARILGVAHPDHYIWGATEAIPGAPAQKLQECEGSSFSLGELALFLDAVRRIIVVGTVGKRRGPPITGTRVCAGCVCWHSAGALVCQGRSAFGTPGRWLTHRPLREWPFR